MAAQAGSTPRNLSYKEVQKEILNQKAIIE
ncbi:hypothetical protein [Bacteroides stercorirosoris]